MDGTSPSDSEANDICELYRKELQRKDELQCDQNHLMSDIQILSKDVHHLAETNQKAFLIKKWGSESGSNNLNERELPEIQTHRLCLELLEDQEKNTDIVQGLQQQQSKLDSEIAQVMSELKDYAKS